MKPACYLFLIFSLIDLFAVSCTPARSQNAPIPTRPKPDMTVYFAVDEGESPIIALRALADNSPALIDVEIIHKVNQSVAPIVPGFSIAPGTYPIPRLLALFQAALPEMTWTQDENAYHVVVSLDKTVRSTLDERTTQDAEGTKGASEWVDWLRQQHPETGIEGSTQFIIVGVSKLRIFPPVTLDIRKGAKFRQILDAISEAIHTDWFAEVKDRPYQVVVIQKDGSFELSPLDALDHPYGSLPLDHFGKTSIDFSSRMSTTEGMIHSPAPAKTIAE